ncbi:MAG: chorismate synthase [Lachnospiraceae bacterium]|nr:chorismate synthase [Robinsoniella sp.]MDY3767730.1 chorismate synthase [Lachnospiraceae bacterium]
MAGSTFGTWFKITTWGESHGKGVGVVVDGCPAGLELSEEDIQIFLDRRKPGKSRYATPRKEDDAVEILSGVFEGKTTGTPISMIVYNKTQRSKDYNEIAQMYRPGHADLTYDLKYGFRDYRGGGRSSGRETIGRVAAGAIAVKILNQLGITFTTYTKSIGPIESETFCEEEIEKNPFCMPDAEAAKKTEEYLETCMREGDSVGGMVECVIHNMKPGIGEPVFEKLSANLAKAICSIGAVKGFELGDGMSVAKVKGSENNDAYRMAEDGSVQKVTNHSGGILGGISDGSDIVFRAAIKPTPSIFKEQQTVNKAGEEIDVNIKGRHDPVIMPRAVVVVETMAALAILDLLMGSMTSRMEYVVRFFS